MYNQAIGAIGEDEAVKYLEKNNHRIIQRNFSCNFGEIDIIAKDLKKNEVVFVEVKTRSSSTYGAPSDSVTLYKEKHILKTAEYFIHINKLENHFIRIDVIEVYMRK